MQVDLINSDSLEIILSLLGQNDSQGDYFGASLLVVDVSGDRRGDLIVGAPLYSITNKREVGRIYYFQNVLFGRNQPQIITAKVAKSGARFGNTFAELDLNRDKFTGSYHGF